jgi:hypothetical protein
MKTLSLKIKNTILLLALMISASNLNYSQTDNDLKELIPSFPVGLRIGMHNDFFSNTNENEFIDFKYENRFTFIAGIDIEIIRKMRWIVTASVFVKNISQEYSYTLTPEQLGLNFGFTRNSISSPYWTYHLPIETLYRFNKSEQHPLFFKAGLELQHYGYTSGSYKHPILGVDNITRLTADYEEYQSPFTFGINGGIAGDIYLEDYSKFRIALTGHLHFQTMEVTRIISTNLNAPERTSTHKWTGHYLNLSLTYFPHEGFLDFLK